MSIPVSPCTNCADKVIGCHSSCERYSEWAAMRRDAAKWLDDFNTKRDDKMTAYHMKMVKKYR